MMGTNMKTQTEVLLFFYAGTSDKYSDYQVN